MEPVAGHHPQKTAGADGVWPIAEVRLQSSGPICYWINTLAFPLHGIGIADVMSEKRMMEG